MARAGITDEDLRGLVRRGAEANAASVRGDVERYLALVARADDRAPTAPTGAAPAQGSDAPPGRSPELARFLRAGAFEQEPVQTYASGGLAVLVAIERRRGEAGGLLERDRPLRVTQVFRREEGRWPLAHRRADPLARDTGPERAAAPARG